MNPQNKAYVEESWDSANHANPLYIVHYPSSKKTLSTMQKSEAQKEVDQYNTAMDRWGFNKES